MSIETQFQREVNRALDADRNTRKRGLQKLFETLPWDKKSTKSELLKFIEDNFLKACILGISDEVEKCREYSLKILKSYFGLLPKKSVLPLEVTQSILRALYSRVNEVPFPEVAEELRLLVVELLSTVVQRIKPLLKETTAEDGTVMESLFPVFNSDLDRLVVALSKLLGDSFPAVKRATAELLISLCKSKAIGNIVRSHSKVVVRSLIANITHQHSKTRSVTLQAVISVLLVLQSQDSYTSLWKEFVYSSLQRGLFDRTSSVRRDMVEEMFRLIQSRITSLTQKQKRMLTEEDLQTILLLILLCGDDVEEVSNAARKSLITALQSWIMPKKEIDEGGHMDVDVSIENAELSLREQQEASGRMVISEIDSSENLKGLVGFLQSSHGSQIISMLLQCISEQWTVEGKSQSLRGSCSFFSILFDLFHDRLVEPAINNEIANDNDGSKEPVVALAPPSAAELSSIVQLLDAELPVILNILLPLMRHDEDVVRHAAESVARSIGKLYPIPSEEAGQSCSGSAMSVWMELMLPRVRGDISGTDTSSQRSMALRLTAQLYRGSIDGSNFDSLIVCEKWHGVVSELVGSLTRQRLLWSQFHQDVTVKEAIILYLRIIFLQYPWDKIELQKDEVASKMLKLPSFVERDVAQIYLYLMSAPSVQSLAAQYQQGTLGSNANANSSVGGGNGELERIARQDFVRFAQRYQLQQDETAMSAATAKSDKNDDTQDLVILCKVLQPHFISLFVHIISPYLVVRNGATPPSSAFSSSSTSSAAAVDVFVPTSTDHSQYDTVWLSILERGEYTIHWETMSVDLLCLQTLCQFCLLETWRQWPIVLPLLAKLVDPSHGTVAAGSMKETMISYASQRGEDTNLTQESLISYDQRMHVMILLEQLIRLGTTLSHFWEAGSYISKSTFVLMSQIFLPNLVWRVGRVEATIRKISLAGVYALMKAGAVPREVIISIAKDTLPVLVSHLDDMDVSPRLMACLSLAVFFDRLGPQGCVGIWDELGLKEIYPKFLARLDDSHDEVRMAACQLLSSFVVSVCGKVSGGNNQQRGGKLMSDTMVEYIIDQLFIHLDDMNQAMQEQVFKVLGTIAVQCEGDTVYHQLNRHHLPKDLAQLVMKKAEQQKLSHRSPRLCERLMVEIQSHMESS